MLVTIIILSPKAPSRVPQKVLGYITLAKISMIKPSVGQAYGKTTIVNGNVNWSNPWEGNCSVCIYFDMANTLLEMCPMNILAKLHEHNYLRNAH